MLPPGAMNNQNQIKIIGNYQYNLRHCLGEGAYGQVFEGLDSKTNSKVAIKKLDIRSFEKDTYLKNQIISEIEILKRFNHKNIVKFIDLITTQRSLYIITEFCRDGDLRNLMARQRLTEDNSLKIMKQIVDGFKELLKQNVIHRDLKPANILIHENVFKIADFGFAKYVDYSSAQMLRSCVGSPLYMAPQILARKSYGLKSDIWSLGVIFHEMIYNDVPWKGRDQRDLLKNIHTIPYSCKPGLTKISQEFLKKSLVIQENDRISWDKIFEMFDTIESPSSVPPPVPMLGKENNNRQFYSMGNIQANNNITNNMAPAPPTNNNNNLKDPKRKSIFDPNTEKTTQENLMVRPLESGQAVPQSQPLLPPSSAPLSLNPTAPQQQSQPKELSVFQQKQLEAVKIFSTFNTNRTQLIFRNFVCAELLRTMNTNRTYIKQELVYQKFLISLATSVAAASSSLVQEVSESEKKNSEVFNNSKELQALSASVQREDQFYSKLFEDLVEQLKRTNTYNILREEREICFMFKDVLNDAERERLEPMIFSFGQDLCKDIINQVKKSPLDESLRPVFVCVDYILDIIITKQKAQKGNDVNYDSLHIEKSEHLDLKKYSEQISSRQQLLNSTFGYY